MVGQDDQGRDVQSEEAAGASPVPISMSVSQHSENGSWSEKVTRKNGAPFFFFFC